MTPGIHLIHKPPGPTSFSVVQTCMKSLQPAPGRRAPRICHGGALDPFASGLLIILVEPATRLFDYLHPIPKTYEATIRWGIETDNGDPQGKITFQGDPSALTPPQLDDFLKLFHGWHDQIPHATSNKRVAGERAYLKAHRGEDVAMPPSRVYLHEAAFLNHNLPHESTLKMTVRGGYYVRALARDLGRLAGCGAHLSHLHRTTIGPWPDPGPEKIISLHAREILPWCQSRILTDMEIGDIREGRDIPQKDLLAPDWPLPQDFPNADAPIRAFHQNRLSFLMKLAEARLQVLTALRGGL
jgi:tRNA pseudouridine55 synthase